MKQLLFIPVLLFLFLLPGRLLAQDELKAWPSQDTATVMKDNSVGSTTPSAVASNEVKTPGGHHREGIFWLAVGLAATIMAGIFVRFKSLRRFRPLFLVASVAIFGFYRGSCPCPVGGFQEAVLFLFGKGSRLEWIAWFLVLLPVTYVFGRVWCGWICQLGALQELVYAGSRWHLLSSKRSQVILRYVRTTALLALVLQLAISGTVWWKTVDPFKAAFNLTASREISWILLGVLLVSSVLSFRPFCRTVCPVGFVLGWISRLPFAAVLQANSNCAGCKICSRACKNGAMHFENKKVTLAKQECIGCGECITDCPVQGIGYRHTNASLNREVIFSAKKEPAA